MSSKFSLAVILPAYNEEENIGIVVEQCVAHLYGHPDVYDFRIVVVDDGSSDATSTIIDNLQIEYEPYVLPVHQPNGGYGSALRTGFVHAEQTDMEWLFFMDSDQQFKIWDIDKLFSLAQQGHTFIAGWREGRADAGYRKLMGHLWTIACNIAIGMWWKDMDCAFKLFRNELMGDPKTLRGEGSSINAELIMRARKCQAKFARTGIPHHPRGGGVSKVQNLRFIIQSASSLLALRLSITG